MVIADNLKTHLHTAKARSSGLRAFWAFKRALSTWSPDVFTLVHKLYIRPVLEYGAPAYYPCTIGEQRSLEAVQRLGTRMIPALRGLTYADRCRALGLFTLGCRRLRADLTWVFRVVALREFPD